MKKLITILLSSISLSAFADASTVATPGASPSGAPTLIMLVIFFAIFYFLFLRPQMKRNKDQRQLLNTLQKGDEVMTTSGICGNVTNIENNFVELEIAKGVVIKLQKEAIVSLLPKSSV